MKHVSDLRKRRDDLVREVLDKQRVLIASHRGSAAGNIVQNTVNAFTAALRQGAHIIECDVSASTDGELFVFHDGGERTAFGIEHNIATLSSGEVRRLRYYNPIGARTDQAVQSLSEVLQAMKDKALINIDRGWDHWFAIMEEVDRHGMAEQVIFKSFVDKRLLDRLSALPRDYLYMPIVHSADEIETVLSYELNLLGIEVVFRSGSDAIVAPQRLAQLRDRGLLLWGNAIRLNDVDRLADKYDDVTSILQDPDLGWGKLIDMGFTIIQTDWPTLLRDYLAARGISSAPVWPTQSAEIRT